jgi:predicted secreted hydrolase
VSGRLVRTVVALAVVAATAAAGSRGAAGAPGSPVAGAPAFDAQGFQLALPPFAFRFPRDHAAHPRFRTEWWYYTGHLRGPGHAFGYEVTFFRVGLPPRGTAGASAWAARDLLFVHLALTDEAAKRFRHSESARRGALGLAGADSTRYAVWLDASFARLEADSLTHHVQGAAPGFALDLELTPRKPPVVHGERGVSQRSAGAGNASHYYSLTRLATRGRVAAGRDTIAVEGWSWMDHEFGSNHLAATHTGWDWFSVQLDDGRELMLYRLRRRDGSVEPLSQGTWVDADGSSRTLRLADVRVRATGTWHSPQTGADYPSGWVLEVPGESLVLTLTPTLSDQELLAGSMGGIAYWEGSVRVEGTRRGARVGGAGYVELTGYAGRAPF